MPKNKPSKVKRFGVTRSFARGLTSEYEIRSQPLTTPVI
jgi:hypothetical protein